MVFYRGILIFDSSRQQSLIAQSSAEAEVYAAAAGVSAALLVHHVIKWMKEDVGEAMKLRIDSSAAKSIIGRLGVGAVRHLAVK
eukprot:811587-Amphidinium_carterae.1